LAGITKIIGQVGLGIIIGTTLYFSNAVTVEREVIGVAYQKQAAEKYGKDSTVLVRNIDGVEKRYVRVKTPITTIPFVKNHEFNYSKLVSWIYLEPNNLLDCVYINCYTNYYSSK
jgi:phospho-N-acetylmuramoyl-pentapeptide-transferase